MRRRKMCWSAESGRLPHAQPHQPTGGTARTSVTCACVEHVHEEDGSLFVSTTHMQQKLYC
jgi:hypothetical protein